MRCDRLRWSEAAQDLVVESAGARSWSEDQDMLTFAEPPSRNSDKIKEPSPEGVKICSGCGAVKTFEHFSKNASSRDGRYSRCKDCTSTKRFFDLAPVGSRTCKVCDQVKELSEFLTATDARLRPVTCAACTRARRSVTRKARYDADPERERTANRARYALPGGAEAQTARVRFYRLGISPEDYAAMLTAQGGLCALCRQPERVMRGDRLLSLAVDHCHETGTIRGLLCLSCNTMLGKVEAVGVEKIDDYISG